MLNGLILGALTAISFVMTFSKWPTWLKRLVVKHELMADILAGLSVWAMLGLISKTLTAVAGAIIAEIILGFALHWYVGEYQNGRVLAKAVKK